MELVIDFGNDGSIEALHNDKFDLGFLGDKKVRRQTDIRFNEETQLWDMHYLLAPEESVPTLWHPERKEYLLGFSTYENARHVEVSWLNMCRMKNFHPIEDKGLSVLCFIRAQEHR